MTRYGFVIDHTRRVGCHPAPPPARVARKATPDGIYVPHRLPSCTVACKAEHDVPVGVFHNDADYKQRTVVRADASVALQLPYERIPGPPTMRLLSRAAGAERGASTTGHDALHDAPMIADTLPPTPTPCAPPHITGFAWS